MSWWGGWLQCAFGETDPSTITAYWVCVINGVSHVMWLFCPASFDCLPTDSGYNPQGLPWLQASLIDLSYQHLANVLKSWCFSPGSAAVELCLVKTFRRHGFGKYDDALFPHLYLYNVR